MASLVVFYRLMVRPLKREPARNLLTIVAVGLGVAVVVAIHLAGEAATGSFRSSLETLAGDADLEISAIGGLDEGLLADLVSLPYPFQFAPRIEDSAVVHASGQTVPLVGVDLIGDTSLEQLFGQESPDIDVLTGEDSVWVGTRLAKQAGETLALRLNGTLHRFTVRGVFGGQGIKGLSRETLVLMDIGAAQRLLRRGHRLDRIYVRLPRQGPQRDWRAVLRATLPAGVMLKPSGSRTRENRKMLSAFHTNLRVLSYISLVVGAFLIYYAISVSVVRRQTEIAIVRALGATRRGALAAFLAEGALFGLLGAAAGLALGRLMADWAVDMMAATVNALYVSSNPGEITVTLGTVIVALSAGVGVSLIAAVGPAREAARIPPTEAMARGRREYKARLRVSRNLLYAAALAVAAFGASMAGPIDGKPVMGYFAALLLIGSSALAAPAAVTGAVKLLTRPVQRIFGVAGLLASRGLKGSLSRTSVLVATLSIAVAMVTSIAVMVGSFRETVALWLENRLQADFYLRPAGRPSIDKHPTMDPLIADTIEALDDVAAVDRFRTYEITYDGLPATLGAGESGVISRLGSLRFLDGPPREETLAMLARGDNVIVSEPFANKHGLSVGHSLELPLAGRMVSFRVVGVYYDYSNERGFVITDRATLLKYLPDPAPTNLAVYLKAGSDLDTARRAIEAATANRHLFMATNQSLRREALKVFDRTFAITYALEAVAVLVAILGMAGALSALVIDRRRELSILRFLGASAQQIRRLILCESGLLGLLANVLGVFVGTLLSLILIFVINKQSFGWTIQFHWPAATVIAALGLVYIAAILAGIYPASVAAKLNPIEVIHEE